MPNNDKKKKKHDTIKGRIGSFLIAIYPVIGSIMLMITYILWFEGCSEMGYQLSWSVMRENIGWSFLSFIGFLFSFWIVEKVKTTSSIKEKPLVSYIVLNSLIAILSPIIITYIALENPIGAGSLPIIFAVAIGIVVGFSLYLHMIIEDWKKLPNELESLKLKHDLIWKMANILFWTITILVISGYYVLYTQSTYFVEEKTRLTHPSAGKLSIAFTIPGVFLLSGVWFGILSPILGYAFTIPRKVATLKKGKKTEAKTTN